MKTTTKSLFILVFFTLVMSITSNALATENKFDTLNARELSNLSIEELISVDFSELIAISNKIADNTSQTNSSIDSIEIPLAVLADLDLASLMSVTNQIPVADETSIDKSIVILPFTAFTSIDLKALIILNESCAKYKENTLSLAFNTHSKSK